MTNKTYELPNGDKVSYVVGHKIDWSESRDARSNYVITARLRIPEYGRTVGVIYLVSASKLGESKPKRRGRLTVYYSGLGLSEQREREITEELEEFFDEYVANRPRYKRLRKRHRRMYE